MTNGDDRRRTAVGVFADQSSAERAVERLYRAGFGPEQIGLVTPDPGPVVEPPPVPVDSRAAEGAALGALAGGVGGGALGAALAAGAIPGIGPVLAGGILAGLAGGAAAGATGGGLVGALLGENVPEDDARRYEREFHSGRSVVVVRAGARYEEAAGILNRAAEEAGHGRAEHRLARLADEGGGSGGRASTFVPPP